MPRPRNRNLQFVWPKDGERGKNGPGGFWGRLGDILTDKGPDVFLQKKGSKTPIKPDRWGNWDSYHHPAAARDEDAGFVSRGIRRYDPHSRRYKEWCIPIDWFGSYNQRVPGQRYSEPRYPRFTLKELRKMEHDTVRGRYPDPFAMGSDWNNMGPERFQSKNNWFWQEAHRIGENRRQRLPLGLGPNPFLGMHQNSIFDLDEWIEDERWWNRML